MKVEPISNGNIRIWLSDEELSADSGADIRGSLRQVLRIAQGQFARLGRHVLAELIPVEDGQVLLLSARRNTSTIGPMVCCVNTLDDLFCLSEHWSALSTDTAYPSNCLYAVDDGYVLVVYPSPRLTRQQARLLREYCRPIGRSEAAAAHVAEYGRLLAAGDALGKLCITAREPDRPEPLDRES